MLADQFTAEPPPTIKLVYSLGTRRWIIQGI
jgi:hypothetical protein